MRIAYRDAQGAERALDADYAICTIPLSVLRSIPADWSPAMKAAIAAVPYADVTKIGLEFKRRFWEEDDRIFGGITWTDQPITQIWYPAWGYLGKSGILTGTYNFGKAALAMGKLSPAERLRAAIDQGAKIHPQYPHEFSRAFAVAWQNIPHNRGGWATYTVALRKNAYPTLTRPDGPIYLAGEHISYLTGWQAGALESARQAVASINRRERARRRDAKPIAPARHPLTCRADRTAHNESRRGAVASLPFRLHQMRVYDPNGLQRSKKA